MRAFLLCLAASAVVLAGCAKEIDDAKAEDFIQKTVTEQVGARVESVSCPSGLTAKKGETFECTVTGDDGSEGKVMVTEKDDQGNVSVSAPFIHVRDLEEQIGNGLQNQVGGPAELDCPEIIVGQKGDTFECDAKTPDGPATVQVTQTDDQGNVRYELKQ
jgi:uncharacterized protein DUF4333